MSKKAFLLLCLFLAVAKGQIGGLRIRLINAYNLRNFEQPTIFPDIGFTRYSDIYKESVESIISSIDRMEAELTRLEKQDELRMECGTKYHDKIPKIDYAKDLLYNCWNKFMTNLTPFVGKLVTKTNSMKQYLFKYYKDGNKNCADEFDKGTDDYTSCTDTVKTETETIIKKYGNELNTMTDGMTSPIMTISDDFLICNKIIHYETNMKYTLVKDAYKDCLNDG